MSGRSAIDRVKKNIRVIIPAGETESDPFDISDVVYGRMQVIGFVSNNGKRREFLSSSTTGTLTMTATVQGPVLDDSFAYSFITPTGEDGTESAVTLDMSSTQTFQFSPEHLSFKTAKLTASTTFAQDLLVEIAGYA